MLIFLKLISYPMIFMGLGVLPIQWNPMRRSYLQAFSFFCYTFILLFCVWSDREDIFYFFYSQFLSRIARFLLMYFALWWNHNKIFILTAKLYNLSKRYPMSSTSRKYWPLICSTLVLALTTILFMRNDTDVGLFYYYSFSHFVFRTMSKLVHFVVPVLYIIFISEFTHLFHQADTHWKIELNSKLAGNHKTNLQSVRIFHGEIYSVISLFKNAFGINLLLYFAYAFLDILIAFQSFSSNYEDYISFASMVFFGSLSIMLMIKFTQELTEASEEIVSNLKSLELANLPNLDQLQVELLVKKVQCQPVVIDVFGIFVINRQLLAEIVMGATTYCNAIVQLRPYIRILHSEAIMNMTNPSVQKLID